MVQAARVLAAVELGADEGQDRNVWFAEDVRPPTPGRAPLPVDLDNLKPERRRQPNRVRGAVVNTEWVQTQNQTRPLLPEGYTGSQFLSRRCGIPGFSTSHGAKHANHSLPVPRPRAKFPP